MTETFRASTQYGDWRGTAVADDAYEDIRDLVRARRTGRNAFVVGVNLNIYESLGPPDLKPFVDALVIDATSYEQAEEYLRGPDPVRVRKVRLDLTVPQFLKLFKRLSIAISPRGLDLTGREYEYDENEDDAG